MIKEIIQFIKDVSQDERIPDRDKKILIVLIALIISPIDIIPDWIPLIGILDDIVILAVILDYLFSVLDRDILLSHYPFSLKSFLWIKRAANIVAKLTPQFIRDRIWQYKPPVI